MENNGLTFLSVQYLSVSELTLQNAIQGDMVVSGKFNVLNDVVFETNTRIKQSLDVSENIVAHTITAHSLMQTTDIIVNGNILVKGNKIMAFQHIDICGNLTIYNQLQFGNTTAYLFSNTGQNIGINTLDATATLDISGDNPRTINVYTTQPTNTNVIARNNENRGIITHANTSTSYIGFYNDNTISDVEPDARVQYSEGVLSIDVSDNTTVHSQMSINPNNAEVATMSHIMDETLIVYGNSSTTPYLWKSLETDRIKTGVVESLVSYDNSTNAFLHMMAPSKKGVAIGGGHYIGDTTRSMGTIGLTNSTGEYYPSINIVSGTSNVRCKSTMGINTHSPAVDNYTVDMNGPLHITNGETTTAYRSNFEIRRMAFSRTNTRSGIAIGTPTRTTNPYYHTVLYTTDSGNTWLPNNLNIGTVYNSINFFYDAYVFDSSLAVIVGTNGKMLYSVNGGAPSVIDNNVNNMWNFVILSITDTLRSAFINTSRRFFGSTSRTIYWFDSPEDLYTANSGIIFASLSTLHGVFTVNDVSNITQIRGGTDSLYIISDNAIVKYSNANSPAISFAYIRTNPYGVYKSLSVLNDTTAVAVGANIISYTNDGANWVDIAVSDVLYSVYMYSPTASIAVGNNILYSRDSNQTWTPITEMISSTSSNFASLTGSTLTNIVIDSADSFSATKNTVVFDELTQQKGNSSILYCYLPYLFNNTENYVLDISGSLRISGDMNINNAGKISSTNDTFYLLNTDVDTIHFGNDASRLYVGNSTDSTVIANHNLTVSNDSSFNRHIAVGGNATIIGNTSIYSRLWVVGDTSLNSHLQVGDDTYLYNKLYVHNDVSMGANLLVLRDTSLNGILRVDGNTQLNRRLNTIGDVSMGAQLLVMGDVSLNSRLLVGGDVSMNSRMLVMGDVSLNSNVFIRVDTRVDGNTQLNQRLNVVSDVSMGANLLVFQDTSLNGILSVDGNVQFNRRFNVVGDASMNSRFLVLGDVSLNSNVFIRVDTRVDGNVQFNRRLNVVGDVSMGANLLVFQDSSMNGNLSVDGNTQLNQRLIVSGDVSLNSNVFIRVDTRVDGNTQLNRRLNVVGDVSMGANLLIIRDTSMNGNLNVDGNVRFNRRLNVLGDVSMGANLIVNSRIYGLTDASFGGNLNVIGNAIINKRVYGLADASFGGNLYVLADSSFGGNFLVGGNATITKSLNVFANVYCGGNTVLNDTVSMNNGLTIAGNTSVYGLPKTIIQTFLNNVSVQFEYNFQDISGTIADGSYNNLAIVKNTITNAYDASYNKATPTSTYYSSLTSNGLTIYNANTVNQNGLYTSGFTTISSNPVIAVHMKMNFAGTNPYMDLIRIAHPDIITSRNNFDIVYRITSATQLQIFRATNINDSGNNSNTYSITLPPLNTDVWITVIINASSSSYTTSVYIDGTRAINSAPLDNSRPIPSTISYTFGCYSGNGIGNQPNATFKRIVSTVNGDYTSILNMITTFNTYNDVTRKISTVANSNELLNVNMDTNLNKNLYLLGDASMNGKLFTALDVSFNSNLRVGGNAQLNQRLNVIGDVSMGANLIIIRDTSMNGNLTVDGNVQLNRRLNVVSDVSMGTQLLVVGDVSMNSNVFIRNITRVDGNVQLNRRLNVVGDVSMGANLIIIRDTSMNGNLTVDGNVQLNRLFNVVSDVSMGSRLFVVGDVSMNSNVRIGGNTIMDNTITINGNAVVNANLRVSKDVQIDGNLTVSKNAVFTQTLETNNDFTVRANAYITKSVVISNDATITGNITVANALFQGDVSINSNVVVSKKITVSDASFTSNISITRDVSIGGSMRVDTNANIGKNITVFGDASFNGNVWISHGQFTAGNIMSNQYIRSQYYESPLDGQNIFIGSQGLYDNTGGTPPVRTIFIGSNNGAQNSRNTIKIGGGNDAVVIGGSQGVGIENINAGKTLRLNNIGSESAEGSGFEIKDVDTVAAAFCKVSTGNSGFNIKVPSSTNIVKLDIPSLNLTTAGITTGFLSLLPSTNIAETNYTIGLAPFDISNILVKRINNADITNNTQVIDSSLGIIGNAYVQRNLAVGKTTASTNIALDVSGNVYITNGFIWQF